MAYNSENCKRVRKLKFSSRMLFTKIKWMSGSWMDLSESFGGKWGTKMYVTRGNGSSRL